MNKKWLILIGLLLLLTIGGFVWYYLKWHAQDNVIKASGTIQTTEVQIGSLVGGRIVTVQAKEGDDVEPGQTLVTLDPYQIPEQRSALKAQLQQAKAQLQELLSNGPVSGRALTGQPSASRCANRRGGTGASQSGTDSGHV